MLKDENTRTVVNLREGRCESYPVRSKNWNALKAKEYDRPLPMHSTQVAHLLAYVTGMVNQELLLQNEYLLAENRIFRAHLPSRLRLTDPERGMLLFTLRRVRPSDTPVPATAV